VIPELRAVFDTSVAVSAALLPRSIPRQAFNLARERGVLLLSEDTLAELNEVLRRPGFDRYNSEDDRLDFLVAYVNEAEIVDVTKSIQECRDPRDDKFLELAVSGNAVVIISGDQDLLIMNPFRGIDITTPERFKASMSGTS